MYHEQLVKHNNLNTKMNLHNDDDNVNDGDIHVINIMSQSVCYISLKYMYVVRKGAVSCRMNMSHISIIYVYQVNKGNLHV